MAIFKIYPFIKARVTTLRNAGIKPTLKRIIFLKKTLMKYQSLLSLDERQNSVVVGSSVNSLGLFPQDFIASVSQSSDPAAAPGVSARIFTGTVTSASTLLHAPPALLLLTAVQLGHTVNLLPTYCSTTAFSFREHLTLMQVAAIGPAYADYRQLIIDNSVAGKFIASETESNLASMLGDIGISKKVHVARIVDELMRLKAGDKAALEAACSQPSS